MYTAAIYARLSVDNDKKKSESIDTQIALIKEFVQKNNENPDRKYAAVSWKCYRPDKPRFSAVGNTRNARICGKNKQIILSWHRPSRIIGKMVTFHIYYNANCSVL